MKVLKILAFSLLVLAGCGQGKRGPATESQLGSALSLDGTYNASEKNTALRICYAFRTKNSNFRGNKVGAAFKFNVSKKDCSAVDSNATVESILLAPLASESMIYDSSTSSEYYKYVQTDQHGALSSVCSSLLQGGDPSRSALQGNELVEISFFSSDIDNVIVRTATKQGADYLVNKEERYQVKTDQSAGELIGQVSLITREKTCANGRVETFSQQFISN